MMAASPDLAIQSGRLTRILIYIALILFAVYFLLPLFVMLVNSVKPLDEIRGGNMLALPTTLTVAPWGSAWSSAQIGVEPTGLSPYFWNSIKMVVPAVIISTLMG
ncbi:MAG: carbohydrate ABC transporter permease, partial [Pseudomonadota bacterium]